MIFIAMMSPPPPPHQRNGRGLAFERHFLTQAECYEICIDAFNNSLKEWLKGEESTNQEYDDFQEAYLLCLNNCDQDPCLNNCDQDP